MYLTNKLLLSLLFLAFCFSATAQSKSKLNKARKQYELKAFNLAIDNYEDVLGKRNDDPEDMANLADCYRHINKMKDAAKWYERVSKRYRSAGRSEKINPKHFLHYGFVLKALGKYDEAWSQFRRYAEYFPVDGNHFAKSCNFAKVQQGVQSTYSVEQEFVNTSAAEFGPSFLRKDVVYSSSRTDILRSSSNWAGKANNQLFVASQGESGYLDSPLFLKNSIKNAYNEGPVSYAPNGRMVAYTKNNFVDGTRHIASSGMEMSIHIAEVSSKGDWVNSQPFPFNGTTYSTGFPCFSPEGDRLFFSSNRPDGFGGYDLFVSYKLEGNNWSTPENLGPIVNSPGSEITPYFDGAMLYFASDRHQGLGGYDIFRAEQNANRWSKIFHLGSPVNSSRDDYGFIFDNFENVGYFVSNRPGGKGNEDLYKVYKSADNIELRIRNASDGSPIANAIVDFSSCGEGVFLADIRGLYSFQAVQGLDCNVLIRKDGYLPSTIQISTIGLRQNREYEVMLSREGEQYVGRILNFQDNTPVTGVTVLATNQNTNSRTEARSDANGEYALALRPNASYVLRYSRPGYRDISQIFRTRDGVDRFIPTASMFSTTQEFIDSEPFDPVTSGGFDPGTKSGEPAISRGYSVQVAAVKSPNLDAFSNLDKLGEVYSTEVNGIYKIRVGVFGARQEAAKILKSVKSKGYKGAFIVEEEGRPGTSGSVERGRVEEFVKKEPVFRTSKYMVQLAAYRDVRWFDDSAIKGLGVIEERKREGWTVKYLSGFDSLFDAQQALRKARSAGFNSAFIVTDENGELKKVN